MILLELFLGFLQVGMFTFGGGYASLPLIRQQIVEKGWMTYSEFMDLLAISEMTPGPLSINAATFVGFKTGGIAGAFVAVFAFVLPSIVVVSLLAYLYRRYNELPVIQNALYAIRPAATGLIISAAVGILIAALFNKELSGLAGVTLSDISLIALALTGAGLVLLRFLKAPMILVIAVCGAAGGALYTLFG